MIVSLIILTIAQFHMYPDSLKLLMADMFFVDLGLMREYVIIISGGVFTGAVVTFLIAIKEYQDERRHALENYYSLCSGFLQNFYNLKYLDIQQPVELIKQCYWEIDENRNKRSSNEQLRRMILESGRDIHEFEEVCEQVYEEEKFSEKEKMFDWIWDHTEDYAKAIYKEPYRKKAYLEEEYDKIIAKYDEQIERVMQQYIAIRKLRYNEVENGYGAIDFIFKNKKVRNQFIYKNIHKKQRDMFRLIQQEAWHFEQYFEQEHGNKGVMISKILEIQSALFETKGNDASIVVYGQYCYEVEQELFNFLIKMYGKGYQGIAPDKQSYNIFSRY